MPSSKFDKLYRQLNPAQRAAVDTIDGPVMVVAGPGTGKTQVLTLRIANILRLTDTSPDSILAITFTNSGVHSMRERLVETIGSRAYQVAIHTFHGFCNELIKRYPEHFPRIVGARPANQADELKVMENVINQSHLNLLKPWNDPYHYLTAALAATDRLKKEKNIAIAFAPDVVSRIIEKGFEPEFGARSLNRFIENAIEDVVVKKIIAGEVSEGGSLFVSGDDL